jgi:hypothetical protein
MKKIIVLLFLVSLSEKSFCSDLWNDELCDRQIQHFRNAIANPRESWAVESKKIFNPDMSTCSDTFFIFSHVCLVFDYWAKIQSGLSVGHLTSFGHFDECIRFRYQTAVVDSIRGQHCMMQIRATEYRNNSQTWNPRFDWREVLEY